MPSLKYLRKQSEGGPQKELEILVASWGDSEVFPMKKRKSQVQGIHPLCP